MKIWRQKPDKARSSRGVARAALDGANRAELVVEALSALAHSGISARSGVWLEPDLRPPLRHEYIAGFHGAVWDQGQTETAPGWAHLSVEPDDHSSESPRI